MRVLAAVVAVLVWTGCSCGGSPGADGGSGGGAVGGGSGGGGGFDDDAGSLPLETFCAQYPARVCAVMVACGDYSDGGVARCIERERAMYGEPCRRADAGYLDYDPGAGARCITELEGAPVACINARFGCGFDIFGVRHLFTEQPGQCGRATCGANAFCDGDCANPTCLPLRTLDAPCTDRQCEVALTCISTDGGAMSCRPRGTAGATCFQSLDCAAGFYCDQGSMRCVAELTPGAACTFGEQCPDDLCRLSDRQCGARAQGAACQSIGDCATTSICQGLTLTADGGLFDAGVCAARLALGAPCSRAWSRYGFGPCERDRGEACLDGVCKRLTPFSLPAGAECPIRPYGETGERYLGFAVCARGLVCQRATDAHPPQTGRCGPGTPIGGSCVDELECGTGACLSRDGGTARTCVLPLPAGAACARADCVRDFTCVPSDAGPAQCGPLIAPGKSCDGYAECEGGYCDPSSFVCHAYGGGGAACTSADDCISASCDGGTTCDPVPVCAR